MKAKNLLDMVRRSVERYPDKAALMWKSQGSYRSLTYRQFWEEIRLIAAGLARLGVDRGDKVAILSENNPKWPIADFAICSLGAVSVPVYPALPAEKVVQIMKKADCQAAVVENEEQLTKVPVGEPNMRIVAVMDPKSAASGNEKVVHFSELKKIGAEHPLHHWEQIWTELDRDQLATIIHTSGTTGEPKGAMLTHGNFLANMEGIQFWCLEARPEDVLLSYLPLSHVFERLAGQFMPLSVGATIAYAESIDKIQENLLEVRPTVMTSVPRLFEKIYARVQEQIEAGTPLRRKIFDWAVQVGLKRYELYLQTPLDQMIWNDWPARLRLEWKLADWLVYRKVKSRLGGRLRGMISGGAALNPEIAKFFWAIDVPVLEGYGLTETSPVIAVNPMGRAKIGTVGKPLPNLEVRIAPDGEVLVRGPSVMKGYYNDEESTAAQISDGWLHTGDLGELDDEGFLRIVDRKKSILVLSTGKNVAPQPLENAINQSVFIEQSAVIGHGRKYVIVLVVPDFENLTPWARKKGIPTQSRAELIRHGEVLDLLRSEVERLTKSFAHHEQPKKVVVMSKEWTIETGELTPTLKVRMNEIEKKYSDVIHRTYAEEEITEWRAATGEVAATVPIAKLWEGTEYEPTA
ncbi:AMP-dependent synthetase/ligase [Lihuaxuella thermophila]|uniref:Long-chain acyl-CoA synthetase n=1 Tax=Lihuaxuella thermophila TaxID=1173111 RepID=A0A1H8EKQ4_9BACL|nr:long-chain fatty acid--CoA ligase [Lihuaxuella thermophila]SEN19447.1 long-chain acyl-CoA synthetase [Lihuaxuella thermophila]